MKHIHAFKAKIPAILALLFLSAAAPLFAGGSMEESSSGAVNYEAARGIILKPEEIAIDSLLASVDYGYPPPEGDDISVIFRSGHRQVGNRGQEEILLIGLKGPVIAPADLPPMNVVFVIDRSGSMHGDNKMAWVKDSFTFFMNNLRDTDYVSLVAFDHEAEVLFKSVKMEGDDVRASFLKTVNELTPRGGTDLTIGLKAGYEQAMANFRTGYLNNVIFLTDGQGNTKGMYEMAEAYRELGIGVSAIGLGKGFDREVIRMLALSGGGTSRFIGDKTTMEETFGTGLPRLIAPAVKDVILTLALEKDVQIIDTWAYDFEKGESSVIYRFPAVFTGDYETIIAELRLPKYSRLGQTNIAVLSCVYKTIDGALRQMTPLSLPVVVTPDANPVDGITDGYVLKAGTVLDYGKTMQEVGTLYYSGEGDEQENRAQAFLLARAARDRLVNAKLRLETDVFNNQIASLNNYLKTLGGELGYGEEELKTAVEVLDLKAEQETDTFMNAVARLFDEIKLEAEKKITGTLAVSGFTFAEERISPLLALLDNSAEIALSSLPALKLVDRKRLDEILKEQKLSLTGMFETDTAIEIGKLLSAQYMLTGAVIPMKSSVAIFSRIINVTTGVVESAAQIVVPKQGDIEDLL